MSPEGYLRFGSLVQSLLKPLVANTTHREGLKMSTIMAIFESSTTQLDGIPSEVSVRYDTDTQTIHVPVFAVSSASSQNQVYAPPFLIPKGNWNVVYEVKSSGWVFKNRAYSGFQGARQLPTGVVLQDPPPGLGSGGTTFTDCFDTSTVTDVNKLGCTLFLKLAGSSSFDDFDSVEIHGDPTIAVVSDPIGGG